MYVCIYIETEISPNISFDNNLILSISLLGIIGILIFLKDYFKRRKVFSIKRNILIDISTISLALSESIV